MSIWGRILLGIWISFIMYILFIQFYHQVKFDRCIDACRSDPIQNEYAFKSGHGIDHVCDDKCGFSGDHLPSPGEILREMMVP